MLCNDCFFMSCSTLVFVVCHISLQNSSVMRSYALLCLSFRCTPLVGGSFKGVFTREIPFSGQTPIVPTQTSGDIFLFGSFLLPVSLACYLVELIMDGW